MTTILAFLVRLKIYLYSIQLSALDIELHSSIVNNLHLYATLAVICSDFEGI